MTVTFPDTTAVVCTYLNGLLAQPVLTRIPDPRPATFVRVLRTGGPRRNLVTDQAQVTVESWAASDEEAHDLAQLARAHLHELPGQTVNDALVFRVDEVSGPADLPDPISEQPRYSQTFTVALRGT